MIVIKCLLLTFLGAHVISGSLAENDDQELYQFRPGDIIIGGMTVVHRDSEMVGGTVFVEIINMLVEETNNDSESLRGVKLGSLIIDTRRTSSHALEQIVTKFFPLISKETDSCANGSIFRPNTLFAGIIGASTSSVSSDSAKLLQAFKIPQISYWSTSAKLSDKLEYPYFFRTVPSDKQQIKAILKYASMRQWNFMSFVYEDSDYGVQALQAFMEYADESNICVAQSLKLSRNPTPANVAETLRSLKKSLRARAVVLFVLSSVVKDIMTQAQADKEISKKFIWIVTDATVGILPRPSDDLTKYQWELNNSIGFSPKGDLFPVFDEYFQDLTIDERLNTTLNPWFAKYIGINNNCSLTGIAGMRKCKRSEKILPSKYRQFVQARNVANAFLMFKYALNEIHLSICNGTPGLCPEMRNLEGSSSLAQKTFERLKKANITGINGDPIFFDENHDPPNDYFIYKFRQSGNSSNDWIRIARLLREELIQEGNISLYRSQETSVCSEPCGRGEIKVIGQVTCCWQCHKCDSNEYVANETECIDCGEEYMPNTKRDGCEVMLIEYFNGKNTGGIVALIISCTGIILTICVACIYIYFWNTPIVKASGKELSVYAMFGMILSCTNTFPLILKPTAGSCFIACILISLGPAMIYAALLAKTLRITIIFRNKCRTNGMKSFIQPCNQVLFASTILAIQIVIIGLWMGVSFEGPRNELSVTRTFLYRTCGFMPDERITVTLIYSFLLTIACTTLATINREVPTGFNEAKHIGFATYTTIVIWLAFAGTFGVNRNNTEMKILAVSLCVSLNAIAVLFWLFLPKCRDIIFRPDRNTPNAVMENSFNVQKHSHTSAANSRSAPTE